MPNKKQSPPSATPAALPKHYEDFCQLMARGDVGSRKAGVAIGLTESSGKRLVCRPDIRARIAEVKQQYAQKVTEKIATKSANEISPKRPIREITFDANDIIMELWAIGTNPMSKSESARVSALMGVADIMMLRAKNVNDLKNFIGWTEDELDEFNRSEKIPDRIKALTGVSAIEGLGPPASLRTNKK